MKVIITRDEKDCGDLSNKIYFWKDGKNLRLAKDGIYRGGRMLEADCTQVIIRTRKFKELFGFTPKHGSRETYELKLIKAKL